METEKTSENLEENTEVKSEAKPLSKKEEKQLKKKQWEDFKKNKKLEKKAKRDKLKEDYACAPFLIRIFHVHKALFIFTAMGIASLLILLSTVNLLNSVVFKGNMSKTVLSFFDAVKIQLEDVRFIDVDMEKVYEQCPLDDEGAKKIAALPANPEGESWTFCIYMVGADLESFKENDLSTYVKLMTSNIAATNTEEKKTDAINRLQRYTDELEKNNLDLPSYLYKVNKPLVASSVAVTNDVVVATKDGCASVDMGEVASTELADNVTIVFQTGGAKRWSNAIINPNRTQRFIYKDGVFAEVDDMPVQDSCDPDTLADFISFCDENYKADHMALILWDHGSGVEGFGSDEIFNSSMTLAELRTALTSVIEPDEVKPYYDFIGFDACLMSTVETASNFEGLAEYLFASQESEPGEGWDYYSWLDTFAKNPTMNGAQIGQTIADTYMDYYVKQNITYSHLKNNALEFSVVDVSKAAETYDAYEALNEKIISDIAEDTSVMTEVSRAASKSIRYGGANYYIWNLIDLGIYMDSLAELYPEETGKVKALLEEAVLYKRSNLNLAGSQGLSVYFPADVEEANGVNFCLNYVYNICDKNSTRALYYYKIAGSLNEEMSQYLMDSIGKVPENLDTKIFTDYEKIIPAISDNQEIVIAINDKLKNSIQSMKLELACYDEEANTVTYYERSNLCNIDEKGSLVGQLDGKWFEFDGSILEAEISYVTDTTETYVTSVIHNGTPSYLTFSVEKESGDVIINSIVPMPTSIGETSYDAALRLTTTIEIGDVIIPLLKVDNMETGNSTQIQGEAIKFKDDSKIERGNLPAGQYLGAIIITDLRGDEYYSPVVECTIQNGEVSDVRLNPDFVGN